MYQHDCPQMMIWCDWTKSLPPILGFYAGQPSMEAWNQSDAVSTMPMQDPTQSHHTPYDPSWSILINAIKTVSQLQIKTTKAKHAATYLYNTSLHKFPYQKDSPHLQPKVKSAIDQEILRAPPPEPLNEPYFLDALQELIGNENSLLFYDAKDWMELKEHKGKVFHLSLDYSTFIHSPNVDWFLIDMDTHELLRYNEPFDTFIFAIWATIEEAKALQPYLARQPLDIVWYTLENMWLWSCIPQMTLHRKKPPGLCSDNSKMQCWGTGWLKWMHDWLCQAKFTTPHNLQQNPAKMHALPQREWPNFTWKNWWLLACQYLADIDNISWRPTHIPVDQRRYGARNWTQCRCPWSTYQ